MHYCPKCGAKTHEGEQYCVSCGIHLPEDIKNRFDEEKEPQGFNKWWLVPISTLIFTLILAIAIHFYLEYQQDQAKATYQDGVELALEGQFNNAKDHFEQSLDFKSNYKAAQQNLEFMDIAINIQKSLNEIDKLIKAESYQQAMNLTNDIESRLKNYDGEVVNLLLSNIVDKRNEIKIEQVRSSLDEDNGIDDLKIQLWQIESIDSEDADKLENQMKERIVNHSFNRANKELNENQFSSALAIVKDALRYVPDNEKLKSLKTTIEKQQVAFETEQNKRIEQALNQYEIEQENNENDAVEIKTIEAKLNDEGKITVSGELKSVATVPIYSLSVKYSLQNKDGKQILENETFLYPETLYPEETANFEYTHYDVEEEVDITVEKISWFLEGQ
ncbi:zinc ribbon domain-containing protein [Piscibacillus salipiscarius]|uniref:Zinc ribbon domain-containing protein n=1 Tax=Piscibacillus salipiscarius TaxID=299480 RepID=A0ABW5QCJ6_9BACI